MFHFLVFIKTEHTSISDPYYCYDSNFYDRYVAYSHTKFQLRSSIFGAKKTPMSLFSYLLKSVANAPRLSCNFQFVRVYSLFLSLFCIKLQLF
jgi:hypothetical protein